MSYIGRFAPSPSGNLHFGSLVTALGSFLQAKANNGKWLVRIEDIDLPRVQPNAALHILNTLEKYGLLWDDDVVYQSQRLTIYQQFLTDLQQKSVTYFCNCTRQRIKSLNDIYDNHCRQKNLSSENAAIRFFHLNPEQYFIDQHWGKLTSDRKHAKEDFILRRKDGLFAYNFVVVIDDYLQNVTEIVRGADLIPVTIKQLALYSQFGWPKPNYLHLPLVLEPSGRKLSKQNHAQSITTDNPVQVLSQALHFLGQSLPLAWQDATINELLTWAVAHWNINDIALNPQLQPNF